MKVKDIKKHFSSIASYLCHMHAAKYLNLFMFTVLHVTITNRELCAYRLNYVGLHTQFSGIC